MILRKYIICMELFRLCSQLLKQANVHDLFINVISQLQRSVTVDLDCSCNLAQSEVLEISAVPCNFDTRLTTLLRIEYLNHLLCSQSNLETFVFPKSVLVILMHLYGGLRACSGLFNGTANINLSKQKDPICI